VIAPSSTNHRHYYHRIHNRSLSHQHATYQAWLCSTENVLKKEIILHNGTLKRNCAHRNSPHWGSAAAATAHHLRASASSHHRTAPRHTTAAATSHAATWTTSAHHHPTILLLLVHVVRILVIITATLAHYEIFTHFIQTTAKRKILHSSCTSNILY